MSLFSSFRSRVSAVLHRSRMEREMDEELRAHIESRARDLERSGLACGEALRRARLEFGGYQRFKEECREATGTHFIETFLQDVRFGFRVLRKSPGFTAVAVLTLALGIGANTAIFTIVDAVLVRPLPYKNPDQLAMLWETEPELPKAPATAPDYQDWKTMAHSFQSLAAGTEATFNLTGAGEPRRLEGFSVAPNMFELLGVHASLGRTFFQGEDQAGHASVVVLTHGLWKSAFGADPSVIGRGINLDAQNYTVIGVMPPQVRFPELWGIRPQFFVPLVIGAQPWHKQRGAHWLFVLGRLQPGVSVTQADAELQTVARNLEKTYPNSNAQIGARVVDLHEQITGRTRDTLVVLLLAVAFLLAIACANVANLMVAQATRRHREIAIRLALGANRPRVFRQLLTETVILSTFGTLAGLMLAVWLEHALLTLGPAGYVPSIADVHLNSDVFLFAASLAVLTGLISGFVPAWQSARTQINDALKEAAAAPPRNRFRSALIVAELAAALVLLFGAGLTIQSLRRVLDLDLGFNPAHVLTMKVSLPERAYPDDAHIARFYSAALERIRAIPGVEAAGAVSELPFQGGSNGTILIEGQPATKGDFGGPLVENAKATPGYFRAMQIPILAGREFTDADESRDFSVINRAMARKFWPDQNAIGKRFSRDHDHPHWIEVIGVVADTREFGLEAAPIPQAFVMQRPSDARGFMNVVVRTALAPEAMALEVTAAIHQVDKLLPVFGVATMEQIISEETGDRRFNVFLLSLFAGLALLLAAVGIYGVMSYLVAQRTQEIGVRMALGARRLDVFRLVLAHSMKLLLLGIGLGVALALASGKLLATIVFEVKPNDPVVIVMISLLLCVVALLATGLPARRAVKLDPVRALRYE
jgi:putative ABC transport system permease protein